MLTEKIKQNEKVEKKHYGKGLMLYTYASGKKAWFARYKLCKKYRTVKIADYEKMTKIQAMKKMSQINVYASKDINPKICLIELEKPIYKMTFTEWLKIVCQKI